MTSAPRPLPLPPARAARVGPLVALLLLAAPGGCGRYRPARFADRSIVTAVSDCEPIEVPRARSFDENVQVSDIYLRRPLFNNVRPTDFPVAGDVNAADEVPSSSWYDPRGESRCSEPEATPPTAPLTVVDEEPATDEDALVVRDARGLRYELLGDPVGHPGLRTGAELVGGHLIRGLGLRAPRAWVMILSATALADDDGVSGRRLAAWTTGKAMLRPGTLRVSATAWPGGIDVGITTDYHARRTDPNDVVDHHDRRTLRAMKIFAHWLGWSRFDVRRTRDVYVGKPGQGHLLHYVVGVNRALGTQDLRDEPILEEQDGGVWWNLVTLGLAPRKVSPPRRAPFPSLGYLLPTLTPGTFEMSLPHSAIVRCTPADEYWAVKRLLDGTTEALEAGLAAAYLPEEAAAHLSRVLESRRLSLVGHGLSVVTPIETAAISGRSLWLRDRAIDAGLAMADDTVYEVDVLDDEGRKLAPSFAVEATGDLTAVELPDHVSGRVTLHIRSVRFRRPAPRACDVHLVAEGESLRIIGVRH